MKTCESFPKGNIVEWNRNNINIVGDQPNIGVDIVGNRKIFCKNQMFFVFPQIIDLKGAQKQCRAYGGEIAVPNNDDENQEILELLSSFPQCLHNPNSVAWIGIVKDVGSSSWNTVNSSDSVSYIKVDTQVLGSLQSVEDFCMTMRESGDWNFYQDCYSATNYVVACNVCRFKSTPTFNLKGACSEGPNWVYYLTQDPNLTKGFFFEGYKRDKIISESDEDWYLIQSNGESLFQLQPFSESPVGRRQWNYETAEKQICSLDIESATMTLSTCSFLQEFTCNDGSCIDKYARCDDVPNCEDGSDEDNCTVVKLDSDYRQGNIIMPDLILIILNKGDPPRLDNNDLNYLSTSIEIQRIDSIDIDATMEMTMKIIIKWVDPRMTFLNIKDSESSVASVKEVSLKKQSQLWLPLDKIFHENAVIGDIKRGDNSYVRVIAQSNSSGGDTLAHTEVKFQLF